MCSVGNTVDELASLCLTRFEKGLTEVISADFQQMSLSNLQWFFSNHFPGGPSRPLNSHSLLEKTTLF